MPPGRNHPLMLNKHSKICDWVKSITRWYEKWVKLPAIDKSCTKTGFQDSSPAGFRTFWTNQIGSRLRFYSSSGTRSGPGFSNFSFRHL